MRKCKTNEKQQMLRLLKTPSPAQGCTEFKSVKNTKNSNNVFETKTKSNIEQPKSVINKATNKQHRVENKHMENIIHNDSSNSKSNKNVKNSKESKISKNKKLNQTETNHPHNAYGLKQKQANTIKDKSNHKDTQLSTIKTSLTSQDQEAAKQAKKNYEQAINKLIIQNSKLKQQLKTLQQKYEILNTQKKSSPPRENNHTTMAQFSNLNKSREESSSKKKYTETIQNKSLTKPVGNHHRYYEPHPSTSLERANSKDSLSNCQNTKTSKLLTTETTIDTRRSPCKTCQKNGEIIHQLNAMNEKLKLQVNEKNTIIHELCTSIEKIQGELKFFEKSKLTFRRYSLIINQLSDQIMKSNAKRLHDKYLKIPK